MTLGSRKMAGDGEKNRPLKTPETVQVCKSDSPDVAFQSPSPQHHLRKGSGVNPLPAQAPPLNPRTLQLYHHLKYLFNNNNRKKPKELL